MINTLYIEQDLQSHPRVLALRRRFPEANVITCERYGEILNRKAQNFRLQKKNPALIVSRKHEGHVLPAPAGYGIGGEHNYYFSHMLNCLYDCRYCFLQGMYRSAHYVWFVNYEDFLAQITRICHGHGREPVYFYSGYDCDSLALEPVTDFSAHFIPAMMQLENAYLELRTKSTQIRHLLKLPPHQRVIIAFSFTPGEIAELLEHKVPSLERRIEAMVKLQQQGWPLGLRFDPLIYTPGYQALYQRLFDRIFTRVQASRVHSISFGAMRMPENFYQKAVQLYPRERLFAADLERNGGMLSYPQAVEKQMMDFCHASLLEYVAPAQLFPCRY